MNHWGSRVPDVRSPRLKHSVVCLDFGLILCTVAKGVFLGVKKGLGSQVRRRECATFYEPSFKFNTCQTNP